MSREGHPHGGARDKVQPLQGFPGRDKRCLNLVWWRRLVVRFAPLSLVLLPDTLQHKKKWRGQWGVEAGGSGNRTDALQDLAVCLLLDIKYQEKNTEKKIAPDALTTPHQHWGKKMVKVQIGSVSPQPHCAWLGSADAVQLEMPTSRQSKGKRSWGGGEDDDSVFHICKCICTRYPEGDKTKRPQRGWLPDLHKAR